jgi:hypothetical protein
VYLEVDDRAKEAFVRFAEDLDSCVVWLRLDCRFIREDRLNGN